MHNIWYTSEEENSTVKIWISQKEWISSSSGSDVVVPSCWWKQDMVSGSSQVLHHQVPRASVYGISTYTYHKNQPNVGKCTIHWSYGKRIVIINHIYIYTHTYHAFSHKTWALQLAVSNFKQFEKCSSNWIISPNRGENKKMLEPPPRKVKWSLSIQVDLEVNLDVVPFIFNHKITSFRGCSHHFPATSSLTVLTC